MSGEWHEVEGASLRVRCTPDTFEMRVFNSVRGSILHQTYDRSVAGDLIEALMAADAR